MKPLRVLIVEDSEDDALLLLEHLRRAEYDVRWERVETAADMRDALTTSEWDVIVADYRMPQFDAPSALRLLQASGLDLPFIIVSGTIGEETAVSALKAGAHDFLLKDHLARLVPALERELRDAEERSKRRLAEEALRESEKRYRDLLEGVPVGVYRTAPDGTLLDANSVCLELLGIRVEDLGRFNVLALYAEPGQRDHWRVIADAGGVVAGSEIELRRPDGARVWVRDTGRAVVEVGGDVLYYEGVLEDITALRVWQEESRRSEARFRALIEYASDVVSILDVDGVIQYQSPASHRVLGYEQGENVGQDAFTFLHPDDVQHVRQVIARGIADPSFVGQATYRFRHKDGSWRWIESVGRNLLDEPSVRGIVVNSRDVTERVLMGQELSRRQGETEALVENAPDAIERFDRALRFIYANPAVETLRGLPRSGLLGKTHRDLDVPDEDAVLWQTNLRTVFETGTECTFEFCVSRETWG